jgi:hypothetical protein
VERSEQRSAPGPAAQRGRRRSALALLAALVAVVAVVAPLRLAEVTSGLPEQVAPDEPTVVQRGRAALDGELAPPRWDWPPLSGYVYAGSVAAARAVGYEPGPAGAGAYAFGRYLFVGVSLLGVVLCGLVGFVLADRRRERLLVGVGAAAAFGLSYIAVRLSRTAHPEHLQIALVLAAFLAVCAYDRRRRLAPLAAAGVLAGLAGATKYLGMAAAVPALVAMLWSSAAWWPRLYHLGVLAVSGVGGFVAGTLGTAVTDFAGLADGFTWQVLHQAEGHLGYNLTTNGWWFHLTTTLPGSWGWPLTVLAVVGVVAVARRGTRAQRLALTLVVPLYAVIGVSTVGFPHYMLVVVPFLAPLAWVGALRLYRAGRRLGQQLGQRMAPGARTPASTRTRAPARWLSLAPGWIVAAGLAVAVAASLVQTAADDARLVRAAGAESTEQLARAAVAELDAPVWAEAYSVGAAADEMTFAFGRTPEVLDCECYAVVSSSQEQRFRRRPERYADEVAVYDALRAQGRVVRVVEPVVPAAYNWDVLPGYGLGELPLAGRASPVGPRITVLDLTGERRGDAAPAGL